MPTASVADTARVLSTVLVPIVAQGPILRRPGMVALAARLDADRRAGRLLRGLRGKYGPDPLLLRVPGRPLALVLSVEDVRAMLLGSPEPYALANREKVAALAHFQPHGVRVSGGPARDERRWFNEEVLDAVPPLTDAIAATVREEAVLPERLTWDGFTALWWPIVRRVVLGDGARDDSELTDLLTALRADANWAYARPKRAGLLRRFEERLARHPARAEKGSLAEVLARTPAAPVTDPAGQVPHWLFAFDAAGIAAYRALALLTAAATPTDRDLPYLQAGVLESVRLWPTTMVILRDSTVAIGEYPAGTGFVIVSSYFQRDPTLDYADRFAPEIWLDGRGRDSWALVPFSGGPR